MHTPVPSAFTGTSNMIAVLVLLTEFGMFRAPLLRSQLRLYALQSFLVTILAGFLAISHHIPELYALGIISFVLKVLIVPYVIRRFLDRAEISLSDDRSLGVASMTLLAMAVSVVGFFTMNSIHFDSAALPTAALDISMAVVLVAFLLAILRSDVVSQAIGFLSLENGVSIASMVVASGLPLVIDIAFLFDLLVASVVFGLLMRVHHARAKTLSTENLDRLKG
ncbi:MAG: hydrogenase [Acidimicrobiaceae bacterium]|nr:hydrogenase [Acidimicrobiaceae bacterium]